MVLRVVFGTKGSRQCRKQRNRSKYWSCYTQYIIKVRKLSKQRGSGRTVQGVGTDWEGDGDGLGWEWGRTGMGVGTDWDGSGDGLGWEWGRTGMGVGTDWEGDGDGDGSDSFPTMLLLHPKATHTHNPI
ncbi:hypothetical protein Pcinc_041299 [Petrolisthes cinctipes]|uniref:Uncharacterized protein n=1 Tax=Petrolisthes cinctipes TaxID=88211 RepID=A0AAE1EJY6_PETCI|nr:hypothetical protein Pcinc_041299 [Petrolisthes cinctipes]